MKSGHANLILEGNIIMWLHARGWVGMWLTLEWWRHGAQLQLALLFFQSFLMCLFWLQTRGGVETWLTLVEIAILRTLLCAHFPYAAQQPIVFLVLAAGPGRGRDVAHLGGKCHACCASRADQDRGEGVPAGGAAYRMIETGWLPTYSTLLFYYYNRTPYDVNSMGGALHTCGNF